MNRPRTFTLAIAALLLAPAMLAGGCEMGCFYYPPSQFWDSDVVNPLPRDRVKLHELTNGKFRNFAIHALGLLPNDTGTVALLRRFVPSDDAVTSLSALQALCQLGLPDLVKTGISHLQRLEPAKTDAAKAAKARVTGILAANGNPTGWAYVNRLLVDEPMSSLAFGDAFYAIRCFDKMPNRAARRRSLLHAIARTPNSARKLELIKRDFPVAATSAPIPRRSATDARRRFDLPAAHPFGKGLPSR